LKTDWNDGSLLCKLVHKLGAILPAIGDKLENNEAKCQIGLDACSNQLKVEPLITAKELSTIDTDNMNLLTMLIQLKSTTTTKRHETDNNEPKINQLPPKYEKQPDSVLIEKKYCRVNELHEIPISSISLGKGKVTVLADSPSTKDIQCYVFEKECKTLARFIPNEIGNHHFVFNFRVII
jgi:hypothetical protein